MNELNQMAKSFSILIYSFGCLTGSVFKSIEAVKQFNKAYEDLTMIQRINKWEGNWLLS